MTCSPTPSPKLWRDVSAKRWHYSEADCIMIGTIKVVFTNCGNWECESGGETGVEALHPSATCRSAWVIHGGHFVSKISPQISLPWEGEWRSRLVRRYGEDQRKRFKSCLTKTLTESFSFAQLASCCFPALLLIIQSLKTGGGHVCCIYLHVCYLGTLQCNCHTHSSQYNHILSLISINRTGQI